MSAPVIPGVLPAMSTPQEVSSSRSALIDCVPPLTTQIPVAVHVSLGPDSAVLEKQDWNLNTDDWTGVTVWYQLRLNGDRAVEMQLGMLVRELESGSGYKNKTQIRVFRDWFDIYTAPGPIVQLVAPTEANSGERLWFGCIHGHQALIGGDVGALSALAVTLDSKAPEQAAIQRLTGIVSFAAVVNLDKKSQVILEASEVQGWENESRQNGVLRNFEQMPKSGSYTGFRLPATWQYRPNLIQHIQGVARKDDSRGVYFYVTQCGNEPTTLASHPGKLWIVSMKASGKKKIGLPLGTTRLETKLPPDDDAVEKCITFDGDRWPGYYHPGGLAIVGDMLLVPLESPVAAPQETSALCIISVKDAANPTLIGCHTLGHKKAGCVAALSRGGGQYSILVQGDYGGAERLHVYTWNVATPELPPQLVQKWLATDAIVGGGLTNAWANPGNTTYQSLFGTSDANGLYVAGWFNESSVPVPNPKSKDLVDLYHVSLGTDGSLIRVEHLARHHQIMRRPPTGIGDLLPSKRGFLGDNRAGAGGFVTRDGRMVMYSIEHKVGLSGEAVRMGEWTSPAR